MLAGGHRRGTRPLTIVALLLGTGCIALASSNSLSVRLLSRPCASKAGLRDIPLQRLVQGLKREIVKGPDYELWDLTTNCIRSTLVLPENGAFICLWGTSNINGREKRWPGI